MPVMQLKVPVATKTPQFFVENRFEVGSYVFRLQVRDNDGLLSVPMDITVRVIEPIILVREPILTTTTTTIEPTIIRRF